MSGETVDNILLKHTPTKAKALVRVSEPRTAFASGESVKSITETNLDAAMTSIITMLL